MYPKISDLINDLLGTDFCFPAQTFGFFVALAFIAAFQTLKIDMRLREKAGQFKLQAIKIATGGPLELKEVAIQGLIWAVVGYKLGLGILNWETFCEAPQELILNGRGSLPFALVAGGLAAAIKYIQYRKKLGTEETFEVKKLGPSRFLGTIVTIAFVAGLIGAKIFHNLENLDEFTRDPVRALISFDGLTFYGGLITAGILISWFLIRKGYYLPHMLDIFAPCLILAYAIGRIGCQMSGDGDWGIDNPDPIPAWLSFLPEWIWAFDYPHNVNEVGVPIPDCTGSHCTHLAIPVFPTPLYETLMGLTIFGVLWFLRNRLKIAGQLAGIYFMLNGTERFLIEKIRVNTTYIIGGHAITQAEIISSLLFLGGLSLFIYVTFVRKGPELGKVYD